MDTIVPHVPWNINKRKYLASLSCFSQICSLKWMSLLTKAVEFGVVELAVKTQWKHSLRLVGQSFHILRWAFYFLHWGQLGADLTTGPHRERDSSHQNGLHKPTSVESLFSFTNSGCWPLQIKMNHESQQTIDIYNEKGFSFTWS